MGGLKGLSRLMSYMHKQKKTKKLAVAMVQEHNLSVTEFDAAKRNAQLRDFKLVISAGRADDPNSTRGGVFILVDTTQVGLEDNDILYEDPGFIRIKVTWGSEKLDIANVYAPARDIGRIDFYNTLPQQTVIKHYRRRRLEHGGRHDLGRT